MRNTLALLLLANAPAFACEPVIDGKNSLVPDAEAAIRAAKAAWAADARKIFSKESVARYEPYVARHEHSEWRVYGTLAGPGGNPILGGTPEARVCEKDGSVKTFHGK